MSPSFPFSPLAYALTFDSNNLLVPLIATVTLVLALADALMPRPPLPGLLLPTISK